MKKDMVIERFWERLHLERFCVQRVCGAKASEPSIAYERRSKPMANNDSKTNKNKNKSKKKNKNKHNKKKKENNNSNSNNSNSNNSNKNKHGSNHRHDSET